MSVDYQPGESDSGLFGGNSNWRGPIWMPVNYLIIESLQKFHHYYGDDFKVECPTGSGRYLTLDEVADELSRAADAGCSCATRTGAGRSSATSALLQNDPHFRDYVLVLRVLPRRHRPRRRRVAPDRLDRPGRQAAAAETPWPGVGCWNRNGRSVAGMNGELAARRPVTAARVWPGCAGQDYCSW